MLNAGTNGWTPALGRDRDGCAGPGGICASAGVQQITGSILCVFGAGPGGRAHPSGANWRLVTGQHGTGH